MRIKGEAGKTRIKHPCSDCGKIIEKTTSNLCRKCYHKSLKGSGNPMFGRNNAKKYYCVDCNKEINHGYKRCHKCAAKNNWKTSDKLKNKDWSGKNNPMFGKKRPDMTGNLNPNFKVKIIKYCSHCNKKLYISLYRTKNTINFFCSRNHFAQWKKTNILKENNPNWNNGSSFGEYGKEFDSSLKERVRFRDNYKCRECGCTQLENGRQLDVHHIDYNKINNILNNLISLCRRCHVITNGSRKYWMDYFNNKKEVSYGTV